MNRLRHLIESLGKIGLAGLAALLFCVVFYFAAVRPAETTLEALRSAELQLPARLPQASRAGVPGARVAVPRSDDLRTFQSRFSGTNQIAADVEKLWANAAVYQIDLARGEYRLESGGPGLMRYHITLPIRATYARLRAFINFILKEFPTAAIDGLRFERKSIGETQLDARIELTLYYSSAGTSPPAP